MKSRQTIEKGVGVLLIAALMVFSSVIVLAKTNISSTPVKQMNQSGSNVLWDNIILYHGALGGTIVSVLRPDGDAKPADDFEFTTDTTVIGVFWQGGYFECELAQGFKDYGWLWNIIFWTDDGTGNEPGYEIYNQTFDNTSIPHTFWYEYTRPDNGREYYVMNYTALLPAPITFAANTKYWITVQGVGAFPPQACWVRHNVTYGGIKLHEAMFLGALWGYTTWTPLKTLAPDGLSHDLNFRLLGNGPNPDLIIHDRSSSIPIGSLTQIGGNEYEPPMWSTVIQKGKWFFHIILYHCIIELQNDNPTVPLSDYTLDMTLIRGSPPPFTIGILFYAKTGGGIGFITVNPLIGPSSTTQGAPIPPGGIGRSRWLILTLWTISPSTLQIGIHVRSQSGSQDSVIIDP